MSKLRVASFSTSIDGFSAGPDQSLENPLGVGGMALHEWAFPTATIQRMFGSGEKLFSEMNLLTLGYRCAECVASDKATHIVLKRI